MEHFPQHQNITSREEQTNNYMVVLDYVMGYYYLVDSIYSKSTICASVKGLGLVDQRRGVCFSGLLEIELLTKK
jgi:hypothetical protein